MAPAPVHFGEASASELGARLRSLATQATLSHAEFLEAIVRFDEIEGWRLFGARDCVRWMMAELGMCRSTAYQELKAARDLRTLPTIAGLYASGKLTWCKVKALLRVATPEDERALAITALELDADGVQLLCDEYRFGKDTGSDAERDKAQRDRRSLTYERCADGSIAMRIVLPSEAGADVIRCLELHEELLFTSDKHDKTPCPSAPQRRADALLAMAHASIDSGDKATSSAASSTADRHLVVTHVDVETLMAGERQVAAQTVDSDAPLPSPLRAAITGVLGGSISPATARLLACEGSLVTMIVKNGEPIAVGRKHRLHTTAQRRAILARDGAAPSPAAATQDSWMFTTRQCGAMEARPR